MNQLGSSKYNQGPGQSSFQLPQPLPSSHMHNAYPPPKQGKLNNSQLQPYTHLIEDIQHGAMVYETESKREKRRREAQERVARNAHDIWDKREEMFEQQVKAIHNEYQTLLAQPSTNLNFKLRLYPLTLEREARLHQVEYEEVHALEAAARAYDQEMEKLEDEYKKGKEALRERMLQGIEEARRRAREDRDTENIAEPAPDMQGRGARKLRNRLPSPTYSPASREREAAAELPDAPTTLGEVVVAATLPPENNHLNLFTPIPTPFPLSLVAHANAIVARKKPKGATPGPNWWWGMRDPQLLENGFEKTKEGEIESDLNEIRRGVKRKRAVVDRAERAAAAAEKSVQEGR